MQEAADGDVDNDARDINRDSPTSPLAQDEGAPLGGEGDGVAPVGCLDFAWVSLRHVTMCGLLSEDEKGVKYTV